MQRVSIGVRSSVLWASHKQKVFTLVYDLLIVLLRHDMKVWNPTALKESVEMTV